MPSRNNLMLQVTFDPFIQLPILQKIVLCGVVFFTPLLPAMIAAGLLILIDTILGVIGAYKQGVTISSKAFGRVLTKMLVYQLLIVASSLVETYLFPIVPFINITLGFVAMTEFISVAENFSKITGKNLIGYLKENIDVKFRNMIKVKGDEPKDDAPIS